MITECRKLVNMRCAIYAQHDTALVPEIAKIYTIAFTL